MDKDYIYIFNLIGLNCHILGHFLVDFHSEFLILEVQIL
jgi:hypothetical protein